MSSVCHMMYHFPQQAIFSSHFARRDIPRWTMCERTYKAPLTTNDATHSARTHLLCMTQFKNGITHYLRTYTSSSPHPGMCYINCIQPPKRRSQSISDCLCMSFRAARNRPSEDRCGEWDVWKDIPQCHQEDVLGESHIYILTRTHSLYTERVAQSFGFYGRRA